ncbi:MAG: glycosyltransferase [Kineosporiaceae bacterium]
MTTITAAPTSTSPPTIPRPARPGDTPLAGPAVAALAQRLRAGLAAVGADRADTGPDDHPDTAGELLERFVRHVGSGDAPGEDLWLLLTLVAGAFPDAATVERVRRRLRVSTGAAAETAVLDAVLPALAAGRRDAHAVVLRDEVVVDVDFCATNEHHTGIQRVVRETLPHWRRRHPLRLVAWWPDRAGYRLLDLPEQERVLEWGTRTPSGEVTAPQPQALVVPYRCRLVLPETPDPSRAGPLVAIARYGGGRVSMIGYDCIPLVSPELVHPGLPDRFVQYLGIVKHADAVAGISESATTEFAGFRDMLAAQGLPGPQVRPVVLPAEVAHGASPRPADGGQPLVLSIGSFEPRKNQAAVLVAAEQLWRAGLRFRLRFIGGGGFPTEFDRLVARARAAGRPVEVMVRVPERVLRESYADARFTMFVSLHEGYGLPVTESLAHGTPVLTTGYGSTQEIAAAGGCVSVDPRDPDAVAGAMRQLLTDDALVARLRAEAAARASRTWRDYADDLWRVLVVDPATTGPGR